MTGQAPRALGSAHSPRDCRQRVRATARWLPTPSGRSWHLTRDPRLCPKEHNWRFWVPRPGGPPRNFPLLACLSAGSGRQRAGLGFPENSPLLQDPGFREGGKETEGRGKHIVGAQRGGRRVPSPTPQIRFPEDPSSRPSAHGTGRPRGEGKGSASPVGTMQVLGHDLERRLPDSAPASSFPKQAQGTQESPRTPLPHSLSDKPHAVRTVRAAKASHAAPGRGCPELEPSAHSGRPQASARRDPRARKTPCEVHAAHTRGHEGEPACAHRPHVPGTQGVRERGTRGRGRPRPPPSRAPPGPWAPPSPWGGRGSPRKPSAAGQAEAAPKQGCGCVQPPRPSLGAPGCDGARGSNAVTPPPRELWGRRAPRMPGALGSSVLSP